MDPDEHGLRKKSSESRLQAVRTTGEKLPPQGGTPNRFVFHPCPSVFIRGRNSPSMKLSEMRELLAARGIRLTKSLGQNFLHDGNQLRRILEAAELTKADKVLEVGPGLG